MFWLYFGPIFGASTCRNVSRVLWPKLRLIFSLEGVIMATTLMMVVRWSERLKRLTMFWLYFDPIFLGLCMQECESSIVTRYEADIPTRRDDFGDHTPHPPHRGKFLINTRGWTEWDRQLKFGVRVRGSENKLRINFCSNRVIFLTGCPGPVFFPWSPWANHSSHANEALTVTCH